MQYLDTDDKMQEIEKTSRTVGTNLDVDYNEDDLLSGA